MWPGDELAGAVRASPCTYVAIVVQERAAGDEDGDGHADDTEEHVDDGNDRAAFLAQLAEASGYGLRPGHGRVHVGDHALVLAVLQRCPERPPSLFELGRLPPPMRRAQQQRQ